MNIQVKVDGKYYTIEKQDGRYIWPVELPQTVAVGTTVAANVLEWGTGALNIDGSRVGADGGASREGVEIVHGVNGNDVLGSGLDLADAAPKVAGLGRWPANTLLTHNWDCKQTGTQTDDVTLNGEPSDKMFHGGFSGDRDQTPKTATTSVYACTDGCPVPVLDGQSGISKSQGGRIGKKSVSEVNIAPAGEYQAGDPGFGDLGGASRFFKQTEWTTQDFPPFVYIPKPSKRERNAGCDNLPVKTAGEVTNRTEGSDGLNSPRAGAGRTSGNVNVHPTVKPVKLMEYLITLVTPPGGLVLDPFLGSGTTAVAATNLGFKWVGCELTKEYVPIIKARVKHAQTLRAAALAKVGPDTLF